MMRLAVTVTVGLSLAQVASANIYTGTGGLVPDSPESGTPGVASFFITVGDVGTIGNFNSAALNTLVHTFLGDLTATLTAPDGTVVTLFDRIGKTSPDFGFGDSSNFLGSYTFKSSGASLWAAAQNVPGSSIVPGGIYAAAAPLTGAPVDLQAALGGHSAQGVWKLTIADYGVGESGSLSSWALDFSVVPSPGAIALVILAVPAAHGRRRRA
jgi:hypothetical protein